LGFVHAAVNQEVRRAQIVDPYIAGDLIHALTDPDLRGEMEDASTPFSATATACGSRASPRINSTSFGRDACAAMDLFR
jgi:hypothetical protein